MRTLYITFEHPSRFYGGGLAIIESLNAISRFSEIDYIGLPFDEKEFSDFSVRSTRFLQKRKNPLFAVLNMLRGLPTFLFQSFKKAVKDVKFDEYDFVYVDFSHYDFVLKLAKKHKLKTVVRVHNIEYDLTKTMKRTQKWTSAKIRAVLNGNKIKKREGYVMNGADKLLFITQNDLQRAQELYGEKIRERSAVMPVCLPEKVLDGSKNAPKDYVLITGSLSFGPNAEGIFWFIENVWKKVAEDFAKDGIKLVVAGSHPYQELIDLCNSALNCSIVDTPPDIATYFENALFYVAPIFTGSGMKVKVAEALSYGLKVLGAHNALIGYDKVRNCVFEANTAEEFTEKMYYLKSQREQLTDKTEALTAFETNFSYSTSSEIVSLAVKEVLSEGKN